MVVKTCSFTLISLFLLAVTACSAPVEPGLPDCDNGTIQIAPTATRLADPDLTGAAGSPNGGDGATYCPTPFPLTTPVVSGPGAFRATDVVNLSLDMADQRLVSTAVGDDLMAVAWMSAEEIYVGLSRGGSHFQVRPVDNGRFAALVFSRANRLHLAYEQDGQIFYRAADQGHHPAEPTFLATVASGTNPQITLDGRGWAHIFFEDDGRLWQAAHLYGTFWQVTEIGEGADPTLLTTGDATAGLDFVLAYRQGDQIAIRGYGLTPLLIPGWVTAATLPATTDGETMTGPVGLAYRNNGDAGRWLVASWVTKRPFPAPPVPQYSQPIFEAVNPLAPNQVANPDHIYAGLNAVRWHSSGPPAIAGRPFSAGLYQTINIPDSNSPVTVAAQGLAQIDTPADMGLRIGIDPTGGTNPAQASVVWSAATAPSDFAQFVLTVPAMGNSATLFLEATSIVSQTLATAVWDAVTMQNGSLTNGGFEEGFANQNGLTVPTDWTAYYADSGSEATAARDVYTVYAAWSDDGGSNWSSPVPVAANQDKNGTTTGAFAPQVFPLITTTTDPATMTFVTIYEAGDPPPGSDFRRYGRPYLTQCQLATNDCTKPPGEPLLPRTVVRPAGRISLTVDPFNPDRALLAWDGLQTGGEWRDVYGTYLVLRSNE